jgi:hypothetical protein
MKQVSTQEHPTVTTIPEVVGLAIVRIEPMVIAVAFDVEHVRVAMRVDSVSNADCYTTLRMLLGLYLICDV